MCDSNHYWQDTTSTILALSSHWLGKDVYFLFWEGRAGTELKVIMRAKGWTKGEEKISWPRYRDLHSLNMKPFFWRENVTRVHPNRIHYLWCPGPSHHLFGQWPNRREKFSKIQSADSGSKSLWNDQRYFFGPFSALIDACPTLFDVRYVRLD